jgi:hypothetical protein
MPRVKFQGYESVEGILDMDYPRRLLKGKKYSQDELIPFLVLVIQSFGGKARKRDVDAKIYKLLSSEFSNDVYHETVSHNVERWKHDIAWAKERARQHHGYVKSAEEAGRGIWELTSFGKKYAKKLIRQLESSAKVIRRKKKT